MDSLTIKHSDGLGLHVRVHGEHRNSPTPLICLHGLTRNAEDFDALATELCQERQCFALDFRGRGRSDYDADWQRYVPSTYAADVLFVMDHLAIGEAVLCGTSLGGLVAMLIAQRAPERLTGVVLNDIGPVIEPEGLARIQAYTGKLPSPTDWDAARDQVKAIYGDDLPDLTDQDFDELCQRTYRETDSGHLEFKYDPNIGRAIREVGLPLGDPWDLFDALSETPTLVLRGERSDILSAATVSAMAERHPSLVAASIPDRGHVPLLNEPASVAAIRAFLQTCA